jgi:hypothetical protein
LYATRKSLNTRPRLADDLASREEIVDEIGAPVELTLPKEPRTQDRRKPVELTLPKELRTQDRRMLV